MSLTLTERIAKTVAKATTVRRCWLCEDYLPVDRFNPDDNLCHEHRSAYNAEHYQRNKRAKRARRLFLAGQRQEAA